ncbi:MAG: phosphoribosylformylglycinamidine cyclo-ligase [Phycisphaerales bacterium]
MAKRPSKKQAGGLTYADAGVDLETYDSFISGLGSMVRRTHGPRVIQNPGGFAGLFRLDYNQKLFQQNYVDPVLVACCDGVGTKLKIATETGDYSTVGVDLVGMSVNDLIVQGAEPLFFLDYIAVPSVIPEMLEQMVRGVASACKDSGCSLIGGETAEMPDVYAEGEFDMAGFAVGVVELKKATDPLRVAPGDVVLGLASDGVHSNGFSLVRKVVSTKKLSYDKIYKDLDSDSTLGEVLLTPTRLYATPIVKLLRAYKVKKVVSGMAHITGGGLAQNVERVMNPGVDAVLDKKSWDVPAVFEFLQKQGKIADDEMARVFNMGVGYVLIVRPTFADAVKRKLAKYGETVYELGEIRKGTGKVRLR